MTRIQCKACPWKKSTKPAKDIPNGYCETKHRGLKETIAEPGDVRGIMGGTLRMMACHETHDSPCVGWLVNQLGPGNNLALRFRCMADRSIADVETVGPQHERFEDTLPKKRGRR